MSLDWQAPFYLAGQLFLFLLGWILVILIVGVAVVLFYAIAKAVITAIKGPKERKSITTDPQFKVYNSTSSSSQNRNVKRLPHDTEFDPL